MSKNPYSRQGQPSSSSSFKQNKFQLTLSEAAENLSHWLNDLAFNEADEDNLYAPAANDELCKAAAGMEYLKSFSTDYKNAPLPQLLASTLDQGPRAIIKAAFTCGASEAFSLSEKGQQQTLFLENTLMQLGRAIKGAIACGGDGHHMHEKLEGEQIRLENQPERLGEFRAQQAETMLRSVADFAYQQGSGFAQEQLKI